MIPTAFDEENAVLSKPESMSDEECTCLSVRRDVNPHGVPIFVSCWKMTAQELEEVKRTGRVWLTVAGDLHPPVALDGVKPFENTT